MRPRVFLADDHQILVDALTQLLEPDCDVVGTASDGSELLLRGPHVQADVFVIDIQMPKINGLDAARALLRSCPESKVIILTVSHDPRIADEAMAAGCMGYVVKDEAGADLLNAIRRAMRGRRYRSTQLPASPSEGVAPVARDLLTPRQSEVLRLLAGGLSMKQAATALGIKPRTVAYHKYTMMRSLGLESSAELYRYASHSPTDADL
ncbi:MAG: response regulator transcription factor [Planctomycetota bacterium]|jgi:DNA-binding NarL/FixJ family response regulator